jgi:hypothetical protein
MISHRRGSRLAPAAGPGRRASRRPASLHRPEAGRHRPLRAPRPRSSAGFHTWGPAVGGWTASRSSARGCGRALPGCPAPHRAVRPVDLAEPRRSPRPSAPQRQSLPAKERPESRRHTGRRRLRRTGESVTHPRGGNGPALGSGNSIRRRAALRVCARAAVDKLATRPRNRLSPARAHAQPAPKPQEDARGRAGGRPSRAARCPRGHAAAVICAAVGRGGDRPRAAPSRSGAER